MRTRARGPYSYVYSMILQIIVTIYVGLYSKMDDDNNTFDVVTP